MNAKGHPGHYSYLVNQSPEVGSVGGGVTDDRAGLIGVAVGGVVSVAVMAGGEGVDTDHRLMLLVLAEEQQAGGGVGRVDGRGGGHGHGVGALPAAAAEAGRGAGAPKLKLRFALVQFLQR